MAVHLYKYDELNLKKRLQIARNMEKLLISKCSLLLPGLLFTLFSMTSLSANATQSACQALFDYQAYDGPLPSAGGVTFFNLSSGDYSDLSWDFGDNNYSSLSSGSLDHFYTESGVFTACLDIWNGTDCSEQFCLEIAIDIADQSCALSDCVYPGDANYDGDANLYDLMTIGVGLGVNGPPRPNASILWTPQPAPDWNEFTPEGINYKHLDCDGNGNISTADLLAIINNYSPIKNVVSNVESDGPMLALQFDTDTILIDENTPDEITLTAGLMVGSASYPVQDIYSLALYMNYDTTYVIPDNGTSIDFPGNSFMGTTGTGELLPFGIDLRMDEQIDLAFTRTDGTDVGGSGRIATLKFIVDADIIDGRAEPNDPAIFEVPIGGVKVANSAGDERFVSWSKKPAKVVFVTSTGNTTATIDLQLTDKVNLYPNPAHEELIIELDQLNPKQVSLFNLLGERVLQQELVNNKSVLSLQGLEGGLYQVEISTTEGTISKRVMVY